MDVRNLNENDRPTGNKFVNCSSFINHSTQFSIETYFVWFSALIFLTEVLIGECLSEVNLNFKILTSKNFFCFRFFCGFLLFQ